MTLQLDLNPNKLKPGIVTTWPNSGAFGGSFLSTGAGNTRPICYKEGANNINNIVQSNGVDQYLPSTIQSFDVIANNAFTVMAVAYIESITFNNANKYDNDGVIVGLNEFWGMHLSNVPELTAFVFSGGVAYYANVTPLLRTWTLLQIRFSGGNLYARAGSTAESGATAVPGNVQANGALRVFRNYNTSYSGLKLARLKVWNTGDADGALATERAKLARIYAVAV
jgi:hypothetical protein